MDCDLSVIALTSHVSTGGIRLQLGSEDVGLWAMNLTGAMSAQGRHPMILSGRGCRSTPIEPGGSCRDRRRTGSLGQVQSVTNVGFAAACRPLIRCNGGEVAIGSLLVNTRRRPHASLKRLQRRPAISCTGGGAPNRQRCAGPCKRSNSAYSPHLVDKRETRKFRRLLRVLPYAGAVQKRRGQHAAMRLRRRGSASC